MHTLPERIAHKSHKLQFEIVAVLGLLALFTHIHLFWVIGLLLALIDLPDIGGWLGRIAGSVERIAGFTKRSIGGGRGRATAHVRRTITPSRHCPKARTTPTTAIPRRPGKCKELIHA